MDGIDRAMESLRKVNQLNQVPEHILKRVAYCHSSEGHGYRITFLLTINGDVYVMKNNIWVNSKSWSFCGVGLTRVWVRHKTQGLIDVIGLTETGLVMLWTGTTGADHDFAFERHLCPQEWLEFKYSNVALEGHVPVMLLLNDLGSVAVCAMHNWQPWQLVNLRNIRGVVDISCGGWYGALRNSDGKMYIMSLGIAPHYEDLCVNRYFIQEPVRDSNFFGPRLFLLAQSGNLFVSWEPYDVKLVVSLSYLTLQGVAIFGNNLATIVSPYTYTVWRLVRDSEDPVLYATCNSDDYLGLMENDGNVTIQWSLQQFPQEGMTPSSWSRTIDPPECNDNCVEKAIEVSPPNCSNFLKSLQRYILRDICPTNPDVLVLLQDGKVRLHRSVLQASKSFRLHFSLDESESIIDCSEKDPFLFRTYLEYLYFQDKPEWLDEELMQQLNKLIALENEE